MARKSARSSAECALQSCGNSVRFDNPSFPYCSRYHSHLRADMTQVDHLINESSKSMQEVLTVLKHAERDESYTLRGKETAEIINDSITDKNHTQSRVRELTYAALASCGKALRKHKVNPFNSRQARESRDILLEDVQGDLEKRGFDVHHLRCESGTANLNDRNGIVKINDHEVLLVELDDADVVIDVATSAPLCDVIENDRVDQVLEQGTSQFGDGVSVVDLAVFGGWSSGNYAKITRKDTGETLWSNETLEESDIDQQRKLVEEYQRKFGDLKQPEVFYPGFDNERQGGSIEEKIDNHGDLTKEDIIRINEQRKQQKQRGGE